MKVALIAALNEEASIEEVVKRCLPFVDKVVVVDDGSQDKTAQLARDAGAHVIVNKVNMGKAKAIEEGIRQVEADLYVLLDADLQHEPESIPDLIKKSEEFDIVIGSRFLGNVAKMPIQRRISNRLMTLLTKFYSGYKITDAQSGFRILPGKHALNIVGGLERYTIEIGMLFKAARLKLSLGEVPIKTIYGDEKSKIKVIKDSFHLFKLLYRYHRGAL